MLNAKESGARGDGVSDDTEALTAALATGRSIFLPAGNYLISSTLSFARDGQYLMGEGKGGETVVENRRTSAPLFTFSNGSGRNARLRCGLSRLVFKGNRDSHGGIALRGIKDDGLVGSADKACFIEDVAVTGVGAGYALRVSSWANDIRGLEIEGCDAGVLLGSEANANLFSTLYITRCRREAIVTLHNARPTNNTFVNTVAQYSGGEFATVHINGVNVLQFLGLYLEGNTAQTNVLLDTASRTCRLQAISYNQVNGTSGAPVITVRGRGHSIEGVLQIAGESECLVRLEPGAASNAISGLTVAGGHIRSGACVDVSGRTDNLIRLVKRGKNEPGLVIDEA
ncbi:hypothetical protein AWV80_38445 [Cupriavidus sp. UYMU48A]|nr:hypothetical protein AWV80_38445 [Cupriavidus sp. UYMU48A]